MRAFLILLVALGVITAGAVEWAAAAWNEPGPAAAHGNQTVILIAPHTGVHEIAQQLQDAHLLNYALVFELDLHLHRLNGKVKAGQHIDGKGEPGTRLGFTLQRIMGLPVGSWGTGSMETSKEITEIVA